MMMSRRKSVTVLAIAVGLLFAGAAHVSADKHMKAITGQLVGFQCFLHSYECPAGEKDLMASAESDFVLVTADGEHYFLPNISTNLKVSYVLETVTVKGRVQKNSILVQEFIWDGKTIWTPEMQRQFMKQAYDHP